MKRIKRESDSRKYTLCLVLLSVLILVIGNEKILAEEPEQEATTQTKKGETNVHKYSAEFDVLQCGNIEVVAASIESQDGKYPLLIEQTIFFTGPQSHSKGPSYPWNIIVRESSDWNIIDKKEQTKNILFDMRHAIARASAVQWDCVKGNDSDLYVIIIYSSGGNCPSCSWCEVYDLHGKVVATTYIPQFMLSQNPPESYEYLPNKEGQKLFDRYWESGYASLADSGSVMASAGGDVLDMESLCGPGQTGITVSESTSQLIQAMAAFDAQAAGQTYGPTAAQLFLEPPLLAASH